MRISRGILFAASFCMVLTACIYPGPVFQRKSIAANGKENLAVFHAYYELQDPLGIIPPTISLTVTEVDGKPWTPQMLNAVNNRIPLEPGLHWVRMEEEVWMDPFDPVLIGIELEAEPKHEYEITHVQGCLLSMKADLVRPRAIDISSVHADEEPQTLEAAGLCSRSEHATTCRAEEDCDDDLSCVIPGISGFGFCGIPSK